MKDFVCDTNILLENPDAIFGFDDNRVSITDVTLEELDGLKKASGDTGYRARWAIRNIAELCAKGDIREGVLLENGGCIRIIPCPSVNDANARRFDLSKPDNRILTAVMSIPNAILITNDIAMQVKASACGLQVQDYHNARVEETNYTGRRIIEGEVYDSITDLYTFGKCDAEPLTGTETFTENEYAILKYGSSSALTVYRDGFLHLIRDREFLPTNIQPKGVAQKFALHALMAPPEELPLVILKGPAGSAKTFLSLAAGLDRTLDKYYTKILITRANVLSDKELGYLKGTLEDKMDPLLAPFYDNLEIILRGKEKDESLSQIRAEVEDLKTSGIIEIASLAYMRGRSIANAYVIVDEVQNLTPGQVLTIVTRVAQRSKLVLCGDPDQIDAPNLDRRNNGLAFVSERMKGSPLCAQLTFFNSEGTRSALSLQAAERLKI